MLINEKRRIIENKFVVITCLLNYQFTIFSIVELGLAQVAGEYGSSREPDIITAKCQNLRVIIEKVHRFE